MFWMGFVTGFAVMALMTVFGIWWLLTQWDDGE
jgi:hypothetical protein